MIVVAVVVDNCRRRILHLQRRSYRLDGRRRRRRRRRW